MVIDYKYVGYSSREPRDQTGNAPTSSTENARNVLESSLIGTPFCTMIKIVCVIQMINRG